MAAQGNSFHVLTEMTLSICKKSDESVSTFLRRLAPLVELVYSDLSVAQRKEKIAEEFLERDSPIIGFQVSLVHSVPQNQELLHHVNSNPVQESSGYRITVALERAIKQKCKA